MLTFTVLGVPKPKGSFRAYTYKRKEAKGGGIGARCTNDNKGTTSWQSRVTFEAVCAQRNARASVVHGGAVQLQVEFFLRRPKRLAKSYRGPHLKKDDLDKLLRGILDALSGVLWRDDAQVTVIIAGKAYAAVNDSPRAVISVRGIASAEAGSPLFDHAERTAHDADGPR